MSHATIDLPEETMKGLEELAEKKQLSLSEVIVNLFKFYELETQTDTEEFDEPSAYEIAAVNASIEEAERPGAKWYTTDEVRAELKKTLLDKSYRTKDEAPDWEM